jgi:hypothetical protein
MPKQKQANEKSLANLRDTTAPDNPGATVTITVRVRVEDVEWLNSLPEGRSYHVRQAVRLYRVNPSQALADSEA